MWKDSKRGEGVLPQESGEAYAGRGRESQLCEGGRSFLLIATVSRSCKCKCPEAEQSAFWGTVGSTGGCAVGMGRTVGSSGLFSLVSTCPLCLPWEALPDPSRLRQQAQSGHLKTSPPAQRRHHRESLPSCTRPRAVLWEPSNGAGMCSRDPLPLGQSWVTVMAHSCTKAERAWVTFPATAASPGNKRLGGLVGNFRIHSELPRGCL